MANITSTVSIDLKAKPATTGGPVIYEPSVPVWEPPADWIDISAVGDNEINLLVTSGAGFAFVVTTASGTYSIDWGDGTIEDNCASNATKYHEYTTNGTPCSLGYETWKVRIYNASGNIIYFRPAQLPTLVHTQNIPLLSVVFGTNNLTNLDNVFVSCNQLESVVFPTFDYCTSAYQTFSACANLQNVVLPASFGAITNTTYMFKSCCKLGTITLPEWGSVTNATTMFYGCSLLQEIQMPTSWGNVTNISGMFQFCNRLQSFAFPDSNGLITNMSTLFKNCSNLSSVTFPSSWGNVTTIANMFEGNASLTTLTLPSSWGLITNITTLFLSCSKLKSVVLPTSWGSVTTVSSMFSGCTLLDTVELPSVWGSVTDCGNIFSNCTTLRNITIPANWGSISNASSMFYQCTSLLAVQLPTIWRLASSIAYMFFGCSALTKVTLPDSYSASCLDYTMMFYGCSGLKSIVNLNKLGSLGNQGNFGSMLTECESFTDTIAIDALLSQFGSPGISTAINKISSIRLTNPNSLFASGGVAIAYCSLQLTALNTLFDDLPSGLLSKTITITGNPGATTISRSITATNGSRTVSIADTSSLAVGMEVTGGMTSGNVAVTFTDALDLVNKVTHGMDNGQEISFATITTTTGISKSTKYFVVNATSNTFQLAATLGGAAIPLTGDGSGSYIRVPKIVSMVPNASITFDCPMYSNGTGTSIFTQLSRSKALLKGWTVTI